MTWPPHSWDSSQTLSGFWEVNGTHAHCLLDSGCEGAIVSPNFAHATGMKLTKLEQPISLQLACVGVMTRSTPVPTLSLHPLGPGPIPDVSSDAFRVASHHVT